MATQRDNFVATVSVEGSKATSELSALSARAASANRSLGQVTKTSSATVGQMGRLGAATASASRGVGGLTSGLSGASSAAGSLGIVTASVAAVAGATLSAANAASGLNEQINATGVTFGQSRGEVEAFAKTTANGLGISETQALKAASSFGQFFKQAGFADAESARFSKTLVQLGGDLASLRDIQTDTALAAISSGLAGESEPLRRLGIDLRETRIQQTALNLGFADTASKLSETDKTAARYVELLRQSRDAQGDAARTGDEFANAQRRLTASFSDLKAEAGAAASGPLSAVFNGLTAIIGLASRFNETKKQFSLKGLLQLPDARNVAVGLAPLDLIGKAFSDTSDRVQAAAKVYDDAKAKFGDGSTQAVEAQKKLTAAVDEAEKKQTAQARATESTADKLSRLRSEADSARSSLQGLVSAQRGAEDASLRVGDADRKLVAERRSLAELLAAGKVDAEEVATAERALADATSRVTDSSQRAADARRELNDLLARGKVDAKAVERAERDLLSARRDEASAVKDVVEAERALSVLRAGPTDRESGDAERDVQRARLAKEEAQARLVEATKELNRARGADRAEALRNLQSAELDLQDATIRLSDAEKAKLDLSNRNKEGSEELRRAEDEVTEARRRNEEATLRRSEAEADARRARAGDPDFEAKVAEKRRDVARADRDAEQARRERSKAEADERKARAGDPAFEEKVAQKRRDVAAAERDVKRALEDLSLFALPAAKSKQDEFTASLQEGGDQAERLIGLLGPNGLGRLGLAPSDLSGDFDYYERHGRVDPRRSASASSATTITVPLYLDGRQVAEVVTAHQNRSEQQGGARVGR